MYTIDGKNVAGIGKFKHHFGVWFFNGSLIKDKYGRLHNAQEGKTKALRQLRYTDPAAAMPQLEVLVAEVRAGDQADLLAQACVELDICALHAGERLRAKDLLIEGMDAAERAENLRAWLTAANALSWMHTQAGEPVSAVVVLMRAVERAQVDGSPRQVAVAASNLGACLLNQGALSEALACYERAATLLEHAVGTQRRSRGLARVGQINALVLLGRLDEARELVARARVPGTRHATGAPAPRSTSSRPSWASGRLGGRSSRCACRRGPARGPSCFSARARSRRVRAWQCFFTSFTSGVSTHSTRRARESFGEAVCRDDLQVKSVQYHIVSPHHPPAHAVRHGRSHREPGHQQRGRDRPRA